VTTREISPRPPGTVGPTYDEWRTRRWRFTGLALGLAWVAVLVTLVLSAEKQQSLGDLETALLTGSVDEVGLTQPDYDAGPRIPVVLRWQQHGIHRYANVSVRPSRSGAASRDDVILGDPVAHLEQLGAQVDVSLGSVDDVPVRSSVSWSDQAWSGPQSLGGIVLALWFGTFLILGFGPEPWRATRWAWGWFLLFAAPFGAMAYVLLGGPLGAPRPRDPLRRLTGGWAFLLAAALFGGSGVL